MGTAIVFIIPDYQFYLFIDFFHSIFLLFLYYFFTIFYVLFSFYFFTIFFLFFVQKLELKNIFFLYFPWYWKIGKKYIKNSKKIYFFKYFFSIFLLFNSYLISTRVAPRYRYSYKTPKVRYFAFEYGAPFFYYADEQWRAGGKFPFE